MNNFNEINSSHFYLERGNSTSHQDYSEKQLAFINYLLKKIGFSYGRFLEEYIRKLSYSSHNFKNYRAVYPIEGEKVNEEVPPRDYYKYDGKKWIPDRYTLVDFLVDEYDLKSKFKVVRKKIRNNK